MNRREENMVGAGDTSRNNITILIDREINTDVNITMDKIDKIVFSLETITIGNTFVNNSNFHNVRNKIIRFLYYKDSMK